MRRRKCGEMEREQKWRFVCPFFILMILHIAGILFFTRGFLLTRTELPHFSHCDDILDSPCFPPQSIQLNATISDSHQNQKQQCWTKPAIDRLVIIVLDALRFDFVAPSTFFNDTKPWMDKLKVLQRIASTERFSSKIFKAIADPPTTSLQRLKGLTTGGLPTFIDVGNSFGAPAIVEDNLLHQLVQNGKKVLMMGDDTWLQLFPHHFQESHPFPSFNVKDLDTVDNGCIEHLLPSLFREDWDVLIAHFLGVDHAGHIFGVDSIPMVEKLEQYNGVLEKVIEALKSRSGHGGIHENTMLLVMGDHGQTINGDHGGGSPEEVETSIFAMTFQNASSVPSDLDTSFCQLDVDGEKMCISTIQQLDFAVTVSALLGIPFPFGSIGRVNPELYALGAGTLTMEDIIAEDSPKSANWIRDYVNILCINSWQVKRYIDVYSSSSVIGFSAGDMLHLANKYGQIEQNWLQDIQKILLSSSESYHTELPVLEEQINSYFDFLANIAELARSKWTEFDLKMMGTGFGFILFSLFVHVVAIKSVNKRYCDSQIEDHEISLELILGSIVVAIRAFSFLSNSFILEEGKVATFLLATTGLLNFRYSIIRRKMRREAVGFLLLVSVLRIIEFGISKQGASMDLNVWVILGIGKNHPLWFYVAETVPVLILILLLYLFYKYSARGSSRWTVGIVITGTIFSYMLLAIYWALESNLLTLDMMLKKFNRNIIAQIIYTIGFGLLAFVGVGQFLDKKKTIACKENFLDKAVCILCVWSPTIILLLGKQGPLVALASITGGWCLMRLQDLGNDDKDGISGVSTFHPLPVTQWNLLAVCLFFCSGHWCAFDGLRYGAAFVGFDEFVFLRQAILLMIDTFGFSHILPILGVPLLVACRYPYQLEERKEIHYIKPFQVYLFYGLITTITFTFTMVCVTIQRRHLMVWGLFAPKFVFDAVGLMLTDFLIFLASLYYF